MRYTVRVCVCKRHRRKLNTYKTRTIDPLIILTASSPTNSIIAVLIVRLIFEKIHRGFIENRIIKLDMSVLHMLRLVMYIDSKDYRHELKGVRF